MKKGNITGGLILILLGVWFLAVEFIPQLNAWAEGQWTLLIIGIGVIFLAVGILNNIPALSIPAFIIGSIGGLLYYQNVTGDWASWAYAWTLIPGFVGLGLLFYSLQTGDKGTRSAGFVLLFISSVLFVVFGSFLGAPQEITKYWPLLLIIVGGRTMFRALSGGKKEEAIESPQPIENEDIVEDAIEDVIIEGEVEEEPVLEPDQIIDAEE